MRTDTIEYYLHPENIKETVEFFENHSQFWKKSQFLAIVQELERLRVKMETLREHTKIIRELEKKLSEAEG